MEVLYLVIGAGTSYTIYGLSFIKGNVDFYSGKDTFFSRSVIPFWNAIYRLLKLDEIKDEIKFQEELRENQKMYHRYYPNRKERLESMIQSSSNL